MRRRGRRCVPRGRDDAVEDDVGHVAVKRRAPGNTPRIRGACRPATAPRRRRRPASAANDDDEYCIASPARRSRSPRCPRRRRPRAACDAPRRAPRTPSAARSATAARDGSERREVLRAAFAAGPSGAHAATALSRTGATSNGASPMTQTARGERRHRHQHEGPAFVRRTRAFGARLRRGRRRRRP